MKRNILHLFLILCFHFTQAQDYKLVIDSQQQFFKTSASYSGPYPSDRWTWSPVKVAYFDSSVVTGSDTQFFSFHTWRDTTSFGPSDCAYENAPSWIGSSVVALNNGMNYFFNYYGDTIFIKSDAAVNDSWNVFNFSNGNRITARVDNLAWASVAGMNDSVKYISLTAVDSLGNIISGNSVNGQTLSLSKSNGFFRAISFREFPDYLINLDRIPLIPMPTEAQIYDFNVNDEFEYGGRCYDVINHTGSGYYNYYKIISKSFSINLDTVIYHRQFITRVDTTIYSGYDSVSYPYSSIPIYSTFPEQNNYPSNQGAMENYTLSRDTGMYNNSPVYSLTTGFMSHAAGDTCYSIDNFEPNFYTNSYSPGLGNVYNDQDEQSTSGTDCSYSLIWYHKGINTWGNYINLIASVNEVEPSAYIKVFPNPVKTNCTILLSHSFQGKIYVTDVTGQNIIEKNIDGMSFNIEMTTLTSGVYFLFLKGNSEIFCTKLIKE